jgi:hypothetical protein
MDKGEPISSSEAAEATLEEALKFLTEGWRANPTLYGAINRAIGCLQGGDASDQAHAQTLKDYLNYPGSTDAQQAAFQFHKALLTAAGRTAAGLPRRPRKKEYDLSSVRVTDDLFQTLLQAEEFGEWPETEMRRAFESHFGEHVSRTTRARLIRELKQSVKDYADMRRRFRLAIKTKTPLL